MWNCPFCGKPTTILLKKLNPPQAFCPNLKCPLMHFNPDEESGGPGAPMGTVIWNDDGEAKREMKRTLNTRAAGRDSLK